MCIFPGMIHIFKKDGGAESIACIRISGPTAKSQRELVHVLFALIGNAQVALGCCILFNSCILEDNQFFYFTYVLLGSYFFMLVQKFANFKQIGPITNYQAPGRFKSVIMFILSAIAFFLMHYYFFVARMTHHSRIIF